MKKLALLIVRHSDLSAARASPTKQSITDLTPSFLISTTIPKIIL